MGWFGNSYLSEDRREQEERGTHAAKSLRVTQVSLPPISVSHLPAFATILTASLGQVWSVKIPSHFAEGCLGASGRSGSGQRCSASPVSPCTSKWTGQMGCCDELVVFLGLVGEAGWDPPDERLYKKASYSL